MPGPTVRAACMAPPALAPKPVRTCRAQGTIPGQAPPPNAGARGGSSRLRRAARPVRPPATGRTLL
eukprot:8660475-Lingulodinium_polyedra.AAC.1